MMQELGVENPEEVFACFNCGRSESEVPLVTLRFQGGREWICTQCFPTLIHNPQKLSGKLPNIENVAPSDHEH